MTVYYAALGLLCLVVAGIFVWFVRYIARKERNK